MGFELFLYFRFDPPHCNYIVYNCVPLFTVRFTFNRQLQSNIEITVKKLYISLTIVIKCKLYSEITVEIRTHLKTVNIILITFAVQTKLSHDIVLWILFISTGFFYEIHSDHVFFFGLLQKVWEVQVCPRVHPRVRFAPMGDLKKWKNLLKW